MESPKLRHTATSSPAGSAKPWRDDYRTLLIVDDEDGPRQSLRLIFEDSYNVLLAKSGSEALELAGQVPIDAAVVDIRMAGMSGIEVLRQLKAIDTGLEVTILTAYAALETARQALRLGATDYLTKPFDLETIRLAVVRMMERRALNQRTESNLKRLEALEKEAQELRDQGELLHERSGIYADVLHDINKPLTAIVGMLSLLDHRLTDAERVDPSDMVDLRQRLKSINRQADNVVGVIQRYLGFFRRDQREVSVANVNQVLLELHELLRVYPGAQTREISFHLLPVDVPVRANSTDLLQILLNLSVNALQATPESGWVEISAGLPTTPIEQEATPDGPARRFIRSPAFDSRGPKVAITVRDEGPGVPPELIHKIFDAPISTKPRSLGTGLGLTIVRKLLVLSRGALALQTAPGVGTTVTVILAAAEGHEPQQAGTKSDGTPPQEPKP